MRKKNEITEYVAAALIFVCAVAVSLGIFLVCTQNSIERNSQKVIKTNVSRQSEHIKAILDIHYGYLRGIAKEIGKSEELVSDENMEMLISLEEETDLERTALVEADGTAHYDNGAEKNVSSRRYFKEAMEGKETLSNPLESSVDKETRVILGVPVRKNGKVIGILGGSYNVTALSHMLFNDFFEDVGYTLITTSDGEIIAYYGDPAYRAIKYGDNFFEFYDDQTLVCGSSMKEVKKDFAVGASGLMKIRIGNDYNSERYLAYTDMGLNDWMICYVIPVSKAQKSYDFIRWYELIFTVGFVIMVCLLILYIFHKTKSRSMQLLRTAETDALTNAYNKRSTEEKINDVLQKHPQEPGTFVIMDVDRFKYVNDRYGHAVGDKVLQQFGQILQAHFREGDIIGRIGGDEFIVFMRKTENKEGAVARIEDLLQKMENLPFAEMNGENVTISVGISFAPEHGTGYLDLYKKADIALYKTKQSGRDGFNVYQEETREEQK